MNTKRKVEVFVAGCPLCDDTVKLVKEMVCDKCDLQIYDLREGCETNECRDKATQYGITRVPAVVVEGRLIDCCENQTAITRDALVAAGIGQG